MKKNTKIAFYPCGLEIPESEIFKSPRNLGIALLGALTGTPSEDVEINRTAVSVGLGCFSLIAVGHSMYEEKDDIDLFEDDEYWGLNSSIQFSITEDLLLSNEVAGPVHLYFNIDPAELLEGELNGIQLFGPYRYLKYIKDGNEVINRTVKFNMSDLESYLEYGCEASDASLHPSKDEFALFVEEKDPAKKFRVLLNLITTFASSLSVRMQLAGRVRLSMVYGPGAEVNRLCNVIKKAKLLSQWHPTRVVAEKFMRENNISENDVDPEVRKIVWGE